MLKKSKAWVDMLRTGLAKVIVSTVLVATAGWANAAPTLFDYPINISPGFGEASEEVPGVFSLPLERPTQMRQRVFL